jgi:hypothetical protein
VSSLTERGEQSTAHLGAELLVGELAEGARLDGHADLTAVVAVDLDVSGGGAAVHRAGGEFGVVAIELGRHEILTASR